MSEKISDYLEKKGALSILLELSEDSKSYNELEESLSLSPNTVLDRLRTAQDLGLAKSVTEGDGGKPKIKYSITDSGLKVLESTDHLKSYDEIRKEVEDLKKRLREKEKEMSKISEEASQKIKSVKKGDVRLELEEVEVSKDE